ncbi:MAG: glycoside hydrolase family 13 protein [Nocardioidaceae bacterium]|nr:glycoside hydrolase family 13 protein [Nocardioidaceae bacterium]MCL2613591.1 glycoside hydrolase family 13 protein [Nocardioidaceae bacterium]
MTDTSWWRRAVVYQVYIRSFADGSGDGIGDIAGLRSRLGHLRDLGVDAIWINPWYASPQADAGYDVADYRAIDPAYGTVAEACWLIEEAHALGIRVVLDIVPNHTSAEHPWFQSALAGDPEARARYLFRPGRGEHGELPPNNWRSVFGGPAWTRVVVPDGTAGEWYCHLFAPAQPDLDWSNPEVAAEFEDILRFWFDKGVDGFRIDVANALAKAPGLPDAPDAAAGGPFVHPAWDQDAVHDIFRGWRKVADEYGDRVFVAEAWVEGERLARYLRPDELHTAFGFAFLGSSFVASVLEESIQGELDSARLVGAPATWVISNHDVVRHATRFARSQPDHPFTSHWDQDRWGAEEPDLALGLRRARAAALLTLGLPGTTYLYQGEELGLPEFEDMPVEARQDPQVIQAAGKVIGRDGCRVPLPWSGSTPPYGFGGAPTWLPQPEGWASYAADVQETDPDSTLTLYRRAVELRAKLLLHDDLAWLSAPDGVLAFARGDLQVWVNTTGDPVALPGTLLLGSDPGAEPGVLPGDAAAWIVVTGA